MCSDRPWSQAHLSLFARSNCDRAATAGVGSVDRWCAKWRDLEPVERRVSEDRPCVGILCIFGEPMQLAQDARRGLLPVGHAEVLVDSERDVHRTGHGEIV